MNKDLKINGACINLGYYQVKASNNITFKSQLKVTKDKHNLVGLDVIEYDGVKYIVGTGEAALDFNKTKSISNKIFVLTALAKMIKKEKEGIFNILITTPPLAYDTQSELLPEYLKGNYEVVYKDEVKNILINEVQVVPETFITYLVNDAEYLKTKMTVIIDIGGRTTNICRLTDNTFVADEDTISFNEGMYNIDLNIAKEALIRLEKSYDGDFIDLLRKNNDAGWKEIHPIAEEVYKEHVKKIIDMITKNNWIVDENCEILLCGGGSIHLEKQLKEAFPNARLSNNPLYDNLYGLEALYGVLYNG